MKTRGFTLIELVVVMVILGVLASIALPQFTRYIEKSRQAEAIAILTRMYKGYKILLIDGILDPATGNFANGSVFNPDESDVWPNVPNGCSDMSWKALGFERNPNYSQQYFSYDFLKVGETSAARNNFVPTAPQATGNWSMAYRRISNTPEATELFPVDFSKRIYIYMNNGTIVKSSHYE